MRLTGLQIPRHDGAHSVDLRQRGLAKIKPAAAFAVLGVEAVALEAGIRKDRSHVAVEFDLGRQRRFRCQGGRGEENGKEGDGGELHGAKCGIPQPRDKPRIVTRLRRAVLAVDQS